jgi:hypothetical protein
MEHPEIFSNTQLTEELEEDTEDQLITPDYIPPFPEEILTDLDKNINDVDNMIKDCQKIRQELRVKALNDKLNQMNQENINKDEMSTKVRNKIKLKELPKTPKPLINKQNIQIVVNNTGDAEFEKICAKLAQQDQVLTSKQDNYLNDIEKTDAELEEYLNDIDEVIKMGEDIDEFIKQRKEITKI